MSMDNAAQRAPELAVPRAQDPRAEGGAPAGRLVARRLRLLRRDPMFAGGVAILALLLGLALAAPWIAPYDPVATDSDVGLSAPSLAHLMGTDQLGRDILSRVIYGARLSILVSVAAVAISVGLGTVLGIVCGYLQGTVDAMVMRAMEILLAFPGLVLALVFAAVLGPGVRSVIIAVGIAGVPTFARVTRGAAMSITAEDYVVAARSLGCRTVRVIFRHVLPSIAGPILILGTLYLAFAILTASTLSFLGVGVRPPIAEWGAMVNEGRNVLIAGWWVSFFPSLMIVLFVLSVNLVGDVLRDRLDATLRSRSAEV
jgi:peptide/nickel transport system permease protein